MAVLPIEGIGSFWSVSWGSYVLPDEAWMARELHLGTLAFIPVHWSLSTPYT